MGYGSYWKLTIPHRLCLVENPAKSMQKLTLKKLTHPNHLKVLLGLRCPLLC